jgi:hypothetical protein
MGTNAGAAPPLVVALRASHTGISLCVAGAHAGSGARTVQPVAKARSLKHMRHRARKDSRPDSGVAVKVESSFLLHEVVFRDNT